jgi:hypothetical protein
MKMNLQQLCASHGLPCPEPAGGPRCFRIIRFRFNGNKRTIRNNVTETEAQAHCHRKDTSSHSKGPGAWYDGYDYMPGCKPQNS